MTTILDALCALIPDGTEQWLAGGGNITVILMALIGMGLVLLLHPRPHRRPREAAPAPVLPARPALEDMTLGEMFAYLRRLDQTERAARQQGGPR